ncbi:MAG: hypothetical protein AAEJ47_06705 [Planctomycetota bacterium]
MHRRIGDRVLDLSDRIDNFFGDPRLDEDAGETRYRVRTELRLLEGGETDFRMRVRGHAVLPNTRKRLGLFLESFRSDFLTDLGDLLGDPAQEGEQQSLLPAEDVSGLRAALFGNDRGHLSLDGGVKLSSDPQARVRLRWREDHELGDVWSLRFIQSLEYRGEIGYGERTQLRFERAVDQRLLRFGIEGVWFEQQDFEALLVTSYFLPLDERTVLKISSDIRGVIGDDPESTGVGLGLGLRRRLHEDWLFGEIAPRVFYPDNSIHGSDISVQLVFEVIFGR